MKGLIFYILQVTIASGILYGYYHFVLRNKKFHHYNRFYLLSAVLVSLFIPFLNIPVYFSDSSPAPAVLQSWNIMITGAVAGDITGPPIPGYKISWFTWQNLGPGIFYSLNGIRLIIRKNTVEKLEDIHFINTTEPGTPFSFFNWLFWNRNIELRSEKGEQVFRHELFHIQQKHSWDVIFMQMVTMIIWINPFFYMIKKELKAIHEFLADEFAIRENQKWQYAEFLLMQALNTQNHLIHPFFNTQIKRRIAMITTSKKPSYQYLRKVMVLPLAAIVLGLFAFSYKQKEKEKEKKLLILMQQDTTKTNLPIVILETVPATKHFADVVPGASDTIPEVAGKFKDALIVVDGKLTTEEELEKIDVSTIGTISILKDKKAIDKYGDKGKNGVIEVTTKNSKGIRIIEEVALRENGRHPDSIILRQKIEGLTKHMGSLKDSVILRQKIGEFVKQSDSLKPQSYFYFDENAKTFTGFYEQKKIRRIIMYVSSNEVMLELVNNEKVTISSQQAAAWGFPFEGLKEPLKFNDKGYKIVVATNQNNQTIAVAYKNGPASVLNFEKSNREAIEKWEKIYGRIPPPPPPPPLSILKDDNSVTENKQQETTWDMNDPEFKKKWRQMVEEVKALAWKEGKAAYEYRGRTYVFGQIKSDDPKIAGFTEQNGIGHVFVLNGELVSSAEELNRLIKRKDVIKFGFIKPEEALQKYDRNELIAYVETEASLITKK
jgi:hypothetical protein